MLRMRRIETMRANKRNGTGGDGDFGIGLRLFHPGEQPHIRGLGFVLCLDPSRGSNGTSTTQSDGESEQTKNMSHSPAPVSPAPETFRFATFIKFVSNLVDLSKVAWTLTEHPPMQSG
jgi:hypothetical protein